jgi:hypothetical protein
MMTDHALMKRYLLGTASPEERTALESEYLSDADAFEELTAAENDLIDSYTRGKLSELDKQKFEERYLTSPERQARVDFSLALGEVSSQPHQTTSIGKPSFSQELLAFFQLRNPIFQWGFAAVCAVALVATILSLRVTHNRDLQARLGSPQPERQPQAPITSPPITHTQPLPQTPPIPPNGGTGGMELAKAGPVLGDFTLQLNPGVSRTVGSGTPKAFVVSSGTSWLNLQLSLDNDDHSAYAVLVETPGGTVIHRVEGLNSWTVSGRRIVVARLPVRLIPAGDYIVDLRGTGDDKIKEESLESYSFRVLYK